VLARLEPLLGRYVFAHGDEGWSQAIGGRLGSRSLSFAEHGTAGLLAATLGDQPWLALGEVRPTGSAAPESAAGVASAVRDRAPADIGVAVIATETEGDMHVVVAVTDGTRRSVERHTAFLGGDQGRRRAVNLVCLTVWRWLDPDATA
jgi:hypothetical protein